jgi:hypothetical protein
MQIPVNTLPFLSEPLFCVFPVILLVDMRGPMIGLVSFRYGVAVKRRVRNAGPRFGTQGQPALSPKPPLPVSLGGRFQRAWQYWLGRQYYGGRGGLLKNNDKAAQWICKAAEQGHLNAQYWMGILYRAGEGVEGDDAQAVYWFRKASEQGHANATYWLGYMYYVGRGVGQNRVRAAHLYRKSLDL